MRVLLFSASVVACLMSAQPAFSQAGSHDALIARHAAANGLPESLVRRVMMKESGGRSHLVSAGNYGLMQIRYGTARGIGYTGSPQGLLDPETNMTYAAKYLAGAYRAAGGNQDRAIGYYQRGYYYAAKRQGMTVASAPGPLQIVPTTFQLASAPVAAALTPPAPREERRARARALAMGQPVADPSIPSPMTGAAPVVQPVFAQPKGRQKAEPGLMTSLSSAFAPDDRRGRKSGTWTKRIVSQEAEAKRVERVRAAATSRTVTP